MHSPKTRSTTIVTDILSAHATRRPNALALRDRTGDVTYADLYRRALARSAVLSESGVRPGDRVAHLGEDSAALYELFYACAFIGAVLVPVNVRLSAPEIAHVLEHCGARLVYADDPARIDIVGEARKTATLGAAASSAPSAAPYAAASDTPLVQLYTSGTTARPKGVVLAHRTFTAVRDLLDAAGLDWINWRSDDVSLLALSASHIGGLWWALQGLNAGITNIVMPAFTPSLARRLLSTEAVTTTCLVPAMMRMVLDEHEPTDAFGSLRQVVYGGSPISASLLATAISEMKCDFVQIYGLTETGNTAVCLPAHQHRIPSPPLHAAGWPYPGVDLEIRDEAGNATAEGVAGEVFLRSPAQMIEYFDNADATREVLVDGWVRTGDVGYRRADGLLVIHDRAKDLIIVGGDNVFPADVEKVISAHPDVRDCAVIGLPDETWGERIHAFIVVGDETGVRVNDIARSLRGRLAAYKAPTSYEFTTNIPRNPSGKILRRVLREQFWSDLERQVN